MKTLEDWKQQVPKMVCATALQDVPLEINGVTVQYQKGVEYVFSEGVLEHVRAHFRPNKSFAKRYRPYHRGEDLTGKSIFVWRFGGLGDLMFIQPTLKELKRRFNCKIGFATSPSNMALLRCFPAGLLDAISPYPFAAEALEKYDYHLTFQGTLEECEEAKVLNAYDVIKRVAGLDFADNSTDLVVSTKLKNMLQPFVPKNTVALQLRSSSALRTYPLEQVTGIIEALAAKGYKTGVIDSRRQAFGIQDAVMAAGLKDPSSFVNLSVLSASIPHLVALLDCCVGSIAVDSSVVHLSAALEKPTLGLYGAFPGITRMKYYKTGAWLEEPFCEKQPCCYHGEGKQLCPYVSKGEFPVCLSSISPDNIAEAFAVLEKHVGQLSTV
jgi:ADP-heptose:LPS heptosyltransferase